MSEAEEQPREHHEAQPVRQLKAKPARRKVKISDIVAVLVFIVIALALVFVLKHQLGLKHEVSDAKKTTDSFLVDARKKDATTAFKLSDSAFRAKYTEKELANLFNSLAPLIKNNQKVIKQTADNGTAGQVVSIYYQFSDPTYYFAVTVKKANGSDKWELLNFSGSPTQSDLFKAQ